jgi:hypothetical protein
MTSAYRTDGPTMPPSADAIGSAAERRLARWPTVISRFTSSPTTRKNTLRRPSSTQWRMDIRKAASPKLTPNSWRQNASNAGPIGEFVTTIATTVARTSKMPADGPQLAKSRAAVRTRWPSVPSIASTRELSSQGPS